MSNNAEAGSGFQKVETGSDALSFKIGRGVIEYIQTAGNNSDQ
jgi:hypothetical protein